MLFYQIGLGGYSEYAYLASRDRTCYARQMDVMFQLPPPLRVTAEWKGLLIEAHPMAFCQTVEEVRSRLPEAMPNLTWLLGVVWAEDAPALEFTINESLQYHDGWSQISHAMDGYTPHCVPEAEGVPTMHIDIASISVQELLTKYGVPDYVILDCESAEVRLLSEFLRLAPSCIGYQIETHSMNDAEIVQRLFDKYGYTIVKSIQMRYNRTEMQAVKDDLRTANPLSAMDTLRAI